VDTGRADDVAAASAKLAVVKLDRALCGAAEVQVTASCCRDLRHPESFEVDKDVPSFVEIVDVEDSGAGSAGGDAEVCVRPAVEPVKDGAFIGGGVFYAMPRQGLFAVGLDGHYGPSSGSEVLRSGTYRIRIRRHSPHIQRQNIDWNELPFERATAMLPERGKAPIAVAAEGRCEE
jgi:hypothetical protein